MISVLTNSYTVKCPKYYKSLLAKFFDSQSSEAVDFVNFDLGGHLFGLIIKAEKYFTTVI